jgi:hypothetical protein
VKAFTLLAFVSAGLCSAGTITFEEVSLSSGTAVTNQWAAFGITAQNAYFYVDSRDTFDQRGLSILGTSPGIITFTSAATSLSIDFWVIAGHSGTYSIFDGTHSLLDSFSVTASADALGAHTFSGTGIKTLEYSGDPGFTQVSTLRFNGSTVPEPSTIGLTLAAFGALAVRRKFARG